MQRNACALKYLSNKCKTTQKLNIYREGKRKGKESLCHVMSCRIRPHLNPECFLPILAKSRQISGTQLPVTKRPVTKRSVSPISVTGTRNPNIYPGTNLSLASTNRLLLHPHLQPTTIPQRKSVHKTPPPTQTQTPPQHSILLLPMPVPLLLARQPHRPIQRNRQAPMSPPQHNHTQDQFTGFMPSPTKTVGFIR